MKILNKFVARMLEIKNFLEPSEVNISGVLSESLQLIKNEGVF